jgi:hypothetical protein
MNDIYDRPPVDEYLAQIAEPIVIDRWLGGYDPQFREAVTTSAHRILDLRRSVESNCAYALMVQYAGHGDLNPKVLKRKGTWWMHLTVGPSQLRVQRRLDQPCANQIQQLDDYIGNLPTDDIFPLLDRVRFVIDLHDGQWSYTTGRPGAHEGPSKRSRTGKTSCGTPKSERERSRRKVQAALAAARTNVEV